jgi:hypothetical protein
VKKGEIKGFKLGEALSISAERSLNKKSPGFAGAFGFRRRSEAME